MPDLSPTHRATRSADVTPFGPSLAAGDRIDRPAVAELIRAIGANNRAGDRRRLRTSSP